MILGFQIHKEGSQKECKQTGINTLELESHGEVLNLVLLTVSSDIGHEGIQQQGALCNRAKHILLAWELKKPKEDQIKLEHLQAQLLSQQINSNLCEL